MNVEILQKQHEINGALLEALHSQDGRVMDKEYEIDMLKSEIDGLRAENERLKSLVSSDTGE